MTTRTMMTAILALGVIPAIADAQQATVAADASASVRASAPARSEAREDADRRSGRGSARAEAATRAHFTAARETLEDGDRRPATRGEIEAGARALAAGSDRTDLERVRAAGGDPDLTASLHALAEMTAGGTESSRAAAAVSSHLARGASDATITRLAATGSAASSFGASGAGAGAAAGLGAAGALGGSLGGALGGSLGGSLGATAAAGARIGGIVRF